MGVGLMPRCVPDARSRGLVSMIGGPTLDAGAAARRQSVRPLSFPGAGRRSSNASAMALTRTKTSASTSLLECHRPEASSRNPDSADGETAMTCEYLQDSGGFSTLGQLRSTREFGQAGEGVARSRHRHRLRQAPDSTQLPHRESEVSLQPRAFTSPQSGTGWSCTYFRSRHRNSLMCLFGN